MALRKLAPINKEATERPRATTSPKSVVRAQAVDGYFLHCLAYIQTAAIAARVLGSARLSLTQQRIIGFVTLTPGITVGELVKRLRITHQGLNVPLRQLIEEGYVLAKIGAEDRRHKRHFATRKGSRFYVRALSENIARVEKAFRAAGPEAVRGFLEVHRHLLGPGDREFVDRASRFVRDAQNKGIISAGSE